MIIPTPISEALKSLPEQIETPIPSHDLVIDMLYKVSMKEIRDAAKHARRSIGQTYRVDRWRTA